jgi:hypothetical protein
VNGVEQSGFNGARVGGRGRRAGRIEEGALAEKDVGPASTSPAGSAEAEACDAMFDALGASAGDALA